MGEKHNFIWGINACMQRFGMILFRIFLNRSWRNGMFLPSLLHTHESSLHKHAFSLSKWKCCDSNVLAFLSRALIQGFSMFSNTAHPFMSSSFLYRFCSCSVLFQIQMALIPFTTSRYTQNCCLLQ